MKLGIDEAGKGCIIGPLVMAAVQVSPENEKKLRRLGVRDSKLLSEKIREELFERIKDIADEYRIIEVSPADIDAEIARTNLNWLEAQHHAQLINELQPMEVVIDCPSPNIEAFADYVKNRLKKDVKTIITCEHKADANHPSVAAASILAKVTRDRRIAELKEKIGEDFGSGYLSEEKTQEFLKENWSTHPDIFRKSWKPYKELAESKKQMTLGKY